jgi:hypothetical protein
MRRSLAAGLLAAAIVLSSAVAPTAAGRGMTGAARTPSARAQSHIGGGVVLPKSLVVFRARRALRHRFGRAYRQGSSKRLSCRRKLSDYWRCGFSFRYRGTRRAGTVTVQATYNGITATVKLRS